MYGLCNVWVWVCVCVCVCVGGGRGFVMRGCFGNMCTCIVPVFCTVCTVLFYCFAYVYLFLFCFVSTSVRTTATE